MKRRRTRRFLLLAIILFISIGFAVLSTNLSINGLFNFTNNTWSIALKNVVVDDASVTKTAPTINNDEDTITFSAELNKPGDYYSFNVDVENNSTLDAMLESITTTGITSQYSDYLDCVITYSNGTTPHPNDILYKTARVTLNVKLLYKDINTNQIPTDVLNPTVTITINFRQANKNAVFISDTNHWDFDYTGSSQTFTSIKTGNYKVELWGAQGGSGSADKSNYIYPGGKGAYTSGKIDLNNNSTIYLYVGEYGSDHEFDSEELAPVSFNGGGAGGYDLNTSLDTSDSGGSGGGATDIRIVNGEWNNFDSLKSRIMVAAGGGGGAWRFYEPLAGVNGGGLYVKGLPVGDRRIESPVATDGTQISGYAFGIGKNGTDYNQMEGKAGGGGGYYTGNMESTSGQGVGGTSYISGHSGCVSIQQTSTLNNIVLPLDSNNNTCTENTTDIKCSYHYLSSYRFNNTVMIDGNGYQWTTEKGNEVVGMPNKNGIGTVTGNIGNGFAKITLIG